MEESSILILFDLKDPEQWERSGRERRAWGREHSEIHTITNDIIIIEFRAGGALEASA